jgi:integrase
MNGKPGRPKAGTRIYWRNGRAYADFRAYSDVGGGREALSEPGQTWGTRDPEVAERLFSNRLTELRERHAGRTVQRPRYTTLGKLAAAHLRKKKAANKVSRSHLENLEYELRAAVAWFGKGRDPRTIEPSHVEAWVDHLRTQTTKRGGLMSEATVRHYLMGLSDLYGRAIEMMVVDPGYNPVRMLKEKPSIRPTREAEFLEVAEAALILEAARIVGGRSRGSTAAPGLYPMVATMLLTGGRRAEVLGLDVEDVSFDAGRIRFRPNAHRGLKTRTSHRTVPLWPQLREILQEWMFAGEPRTTGLLFPARGGGMVGDIRKSLDAMAELCGMKEGDIRTKAFRHTYCSARLQTVQRIIRPGKDPAVDEDAYEWVEVSRFTVAKEMGHGGTALVDRVYGHAHDTPHRLEVVEFRAENHRADLGDRLRALEVAASG